MEENKGIELNDRVSILENDMKSLSGEVSKCVLGCGLDPYKEEMRERCQRLSEKINNNKDQAVEQKHQLEKDINTSEEVTMEKIKNIKLVLSRLFSAVLIVSIFFGGVIGTIQINKVSQSEYDNHLRATELDIEAENKRFDKMINTFELHRRERDVKIDNLLIKQLDFNDRILQHNALLEKQIEVLRIRVDLGNKK